MSAKLGIGIFLVTGVCLVAGQFLLANYARSLQEPWEIKHVVGQTATSPTFFAAVVAYGAAVILYMVLVRSYTVVATNLPLMVLIIVLNLVFSLGVGESLSATQWIGAILAGSGIILLHGW